MMRKIKAMFSMLAVVLLLGLTAFFAPVQASAAGQNAPCLVKVGTKEMTDAKLTKGGYTYVDYYNGDVKVDLYTYDIPESASKVSLEFADGKYLIYNYKTDGMTYLAGWVDDPTVGTDNLVCKVDVNKDGELDVLQIQNPYTVDEAGNWGGGNLLYAITFRKIPVCEKPAGVTVTKEATDLKVSWDKVSYAKEYAVYRKVNDGSFKKVTTTSSRTYTDENVYIGKKYTYYVKALNKFGKASEASKTASKKFVKAVKLKALSSDKAGQLTAKWGKYSQLSGYQLAYATTKDFSDIKYKLIKDNTVGTKTVKSLTKGGKYYVKVRSFKMFDDQRVYSVWSDAQRVTIAK